MMIEAADGTASAIRASNDPSGHLHVGPPSGRSGRVQRAIGEYSSASDELHVSYATAPDPRTGHILYSALIVLRPDGRLSSPARDVLARSV
jgi:hypothetical protein